MTTVQIPRAVLQQWRDALNEACATLEDAERFKAEEQRLDALASMDAALTAQPEQSHACEILSTVLHFIPASESELMRDVSALCHSMRAAQPEKAVSWGLVYKDSTPGLNVMHSAFENWFQAQPFATQAGIKQADMKHLVKVTAEFEFVILVDDDESEPEICERFVQDALRDMSPSDVLYQTEPYHDGCIIDGWDGSIEPYNGGGKSTDEWAAVLDNA